MKVLFLGDKKIIDKYVLFSKIYNFIYKSEEINLDFHYNELFMILKVLNQ